MKLLRNLALLGALGYAAYQLRRILQRQHAAERTAEREAHGNRATNNEQRGTLPPTPSPR